MTLVPLLPGTLPGPCMNYLSPRMRSLVHPGSACLGPSSLGGRCWCLGHIRQQEGGVGSISWRGGLSLPMRACEEPRKILTGTEHGGNPGDRVAKNLGQDKGFLLWWGGHREPVGTKVALLGPYPDTHKQAHFTDEAPNTEVLTTVDTAGGHEVTPHHH